MVFDVLELKETDKQQYHFDQIFMNKNFQTNEN